MTHLALSSSVKYMIFDINIGNEICYQNNYICKEQSLDILTRYFQVVFIQNAVVFFGTGHFIV